MSETTRKLRKFGEGCEGHNLIDWYHMYLGMDLAADAIEAVEAQVAEVVARVDAAERWAGVKFQAPASTVASASPAAPSAVPAPRGFRVGDRVRITKARDCSRDWIGCEGRIVAECNDSLLGDWRIGDLSKFKHIRTVPMFGENLTLVRAAAAPEAPAEEDTGLVVQRIRDEATKPLHVEIEKLRGEVARITKERDEAREFHELAEGDLRKWIDRCNERDKDVSDLRAKYLTLEARAEKAEKECADARAISAATAERVRNETQSATELRKDLADANGARDRLVRELSGERVERDYWKTRAEDVTKERDALRAELDTLKAKPRFRTRAVTEADVGEMLAHNGSFYESCRALGFRRRVEQSK